MKIKLQKMLRHKLQWLLLLAALLGVSQGMWSRTQVYVVSQDYEPYIYVWNCGNGGCNGSSWPGVKMTEAGTTTINNNCYTVYTYTCNNGFGNFIISNNGSSQTGDLDASNNNNAYIVKAGSTTNTWQNITVTPLSTVWELVGFNDWSHPIQLTGGGTTLSCTVTLNANTTYAQNTDNGFKIRKTNGCAVTWYGNTGTMKPYNCSEWTFSDNSQNCGITTVIGGTYTFSLNTTNNKLTVTYPKYSITIKIKKSELAGILTPSKIYVWKNYDSENRAITAAWTGDNIDSDGTWYYKTVQSPYDTGIKFCANENGNTHQTSDTNVGTITDGSTYCYKYKSGSGNAVVLELTDCCTAPNVISVAGDATICSGNSTDVTVGDDSHPSQSVYTYELYKNGSALTPAVTQTGNGSSALTFSVSAAGEYTVKAYETVSFGCLTNMSGSATVVVVAGVPTIATSGAGTAVTESGDLCDGSEITLTAPTAFTNSPTQYQWSINGGAYTSLSANNTKAYTISGTSDFTVNVKAANVCGTSDASPTTTFSSIGTKASIIDQPTNQTVCQNGISSGLSVMASGTNPTYQWYSYTSSEGAGESLIAGAENSSYTPSTTTAGTFYYACKVNACGSSTVSSNIVTFTVTESPVIYLTGTGANGASATYPWEYMTITVDRGTGKTSPSDLDVTFTEEPSFSSGTAPAHSVTITGEEGDKTYKLKSAKTVNDAHYYTVKANGSNAGCAAAEAEYKVYINSAPAELCE